MDIRLLQGDIFEHETPVLVLSQFLSTLQPGVYQLDKLLGGIISQEIKSKKIDTSPGSINVYHTADILAARKVYIVYMTPSAEYKDHGAPLEETIQKVIVKIAYEGEKSCTFYLNTYSTPGLESTVNNYLTGIYRGLCRLDSNNPFQLIDYIDLVERNAQHIQQISAGIREFLISNNASHVAEYKNFLTEQNAPIISKNAVIKLMALWELTNTDYKAPKPFNNTTTYDVFISYRRDRNSETARLIQLALKERGLKVFLDVDELQSGHFDEKLLKVIEDSPNFIVILSHGSLEAHKAPGDWFSREIEHAIKTNRNIIPVFMSGFKFSDDLDTPENLLSLKRHQGVNYNHEFFYATMEKLIKYLR